MACIERYIKDAENIFDEISLRHNRAQNNVYTEYKAVRTIQRWFRGFITRKHLAYLNKSSTIIQKYWRGYVGRKKYRNLLKETVHKLYWEHYNKMATKIQKVWRGHLVRTQEFSYYRLKAYINHILEKNKEFLEQSKSYESYIRQITEKQNDKECQDLFKYVCFRLHHLIRTHQIERILSKHGTQEYSDLELLLKDFNFKDLMDTKLATSSRKTPDKIKENYIFEGRLRECEDVWRSRNNPGKYTLATGEYGVDEKLHKQQERARDELRIMQDKPMQFGPVRYNDFGTKLADKKYVCPLLHRAAIKRV